MAHYAHLAMEAAEYTSCQPDFHLPQYLDPALRRYAELQILLYELEAVRPHSPSDPLYDRFFYSDFVSEELLYSVQDLLQAMREVKEEIYDQDMLWLEEQRFLTSIRNTGADQHGQVVFAAVFLPECARCA